MMLPASEKFFGAIDVQQLDETEIIPDDVKEGMKDLGVYGMQVPTEYGGVGLNNCQYARFAEGAGTGDLGIGIFMGAHQSIGYKGITLFGKLLPCAKARNKLGR
jgi:very long chain acyl-CoA dehydrogenase